MRPLGKYYLIFIFTFTTSNVSFSPLQLNLVCLCNYFIGVKREGLVDWQKIRLFILNKQRERTNINGMIHSLRSIFLQNDVNLLITE